MNIPGMTWLAGQSRYQPAPQPSTDVSAPVHMDPFTGASRYTAGATTPATVLQDSQATSKILPFVRGEACFVMKSDNFTAQMHFIQASQLISNASEGVRIR